MKKSLVAAAFVSLMSVTSASTGASAAPLQAPSATTQLGKSAIVDVQIRRDFKKGNRKFRKGKRNRRWVPGRRYNSAPYGYRRYNSRPYNWRTRGCIIVGPVWFCP